MEGKWLSVLEFASYKNKSISTVRRYIKANRVKYKEESGKYLIWTKNYVPNETAQEKESLSLKFELERLKKENKELKEKLMEANMLISVYESEAQKPVKNIEMNLPELPIDL